MPPKGPFRTARHGSVRVPIYRTTTRTGESYVVAWYEGGTRRRRAFARLDEANAYAGRLAASLADLGTSALSLTGEELLAYRRALDAVAEHRAPLDAVAAEWATARRILGARSLVDAAREYAARHGAAVECPPTRRIVEEMLESKRAAGRSPEHLRDLQTRLGRFAADVSGRLPTVTADDVAAWVAGLGVSPRSTRNYLVAVGSLARWAARRGYAPRGWLDLSGIDRPREVSEVRAFTPDALRGILSAAQAIRPDLVPFLALGAFAGLRHAEAQRLDWADIREDVIDVRACHAKTRQRRLVPILDPLPLWLAPHRRASGPVCPLRDLSHWLPRIADHAAEVWVRNGLRHGYGTHRLAVIHDEARVALEMGNTPGMIFRHYREAVTEAVGRAWFEVRPA